LALVDLSVVEQRYRAVLAVQSGVPVVEVAAEAGVSRQSVHTWVRRYRADGLAGLNDRSRRPDSSPNQTTPAVEVAVCELRRAHPRWGARTIAHELGRQGVTPVPARNTVHRILVRHGLVEPRSRRRKKSDYKRWQRDAPMALWQLDIVGGVLVRGASGEVVEAKVVTGVDDHSRFCVIAAVVARATGRAVCLAFAGALRRFGVPDEVLTDNGKQFTARFGRGGEVLFDRICRDNGIAHRLTAPASPTTTGKIERFHLTLRRELLDTGEIHENVEDAQAAVDGFVARYNHERPHQALDMATPATRFRPRPAADGGGELLPLRLPAHLEPVATETEPEAVPDGQGEDVEAVELVTVPGPYTGGPVMFERVVPAAGNMTLAGRQIWLGPARAGLTVTFWADTDVIHLLAAGTRLKTLRSHLSVNDLAALVARGARPAGPAPLPAFDGTTAIEVDRVIRRSGTVSLGGHQLVVSERLAGQQVAIRIEAATTTFFDVSERIVLRTRPNPLTADQIVRLKGARPAGPPPRPPVEPVTIQRRVSDTGVVVVARQPVALGRIYAGQTVTIHATETTLTVELDGGPRTIRRTNNRPVNYRKAHRPRKAPYVS
jgi:transposase InsO family protein